MKFCPYCGADLLDENVLFCSNCGKKLPPHEAGITEPLTEENRPVPEKPSKEEPSSQKKKRNKKIARKPAHVVEDGSKRRVTVRMSVQNRKHHMMAVCQKLCGIPIVPPG